MAKNYFLQVKRGLIKFSQLKKFKEEVRQMLIDEGLEELIDE